MKMFVCAMIFLAVALAADAYGNVIFEFTGTLRGLDSRDIKGELSVSDDGLMSALELIVEPSEEGGAETFFSSADFVRFAAASGDVEDVVGYQDFAGPVGGSLTFVGLGLAEVGTVEPEIYSGTVVVWDDSAGFSASSADGVFRLVSVPEPGSVIACGIGIFSVLGLIALKR